MSTQSTAISILEIPLVRGAFGLSFFVFVFIAFLYLFGSNPARFVESLDPERTRDWVLLSGLLAAAFVAGYLSGWTRTPLALLLLGVALFPVYLFVAFLACGLGESADCQTETGAIVMSAFFAVGFVTPILIYKVYFWLISPWPPQDPGKELEEPVGDGQAATEGARPD